VTIHLIQFGIFLWLAFFIAWFVLAMRIDFHYRPLIKAEFPAIDFGDEQAAVRRNTLNARQCVLEKWANVCLTIFSIPIVLAIIYVVLRAFKVL
jgi:hypothetical protein